MTYHFIGLGGIGMSALARILLEKGEQVQGSDLKSTPLLEALKKEGADVRIGHAAESIENAQTVVYSTDIKEDNVEWVRAKEGKWKILHRSDLLHELMKGKKNLLVSGTHGKTTTTALLASVFLEAKLDPSFVVGGMIRSTQKNGHAGKGDYFIAEADESDGSFLKTPAHCAILTNLENDHLEYWGSHRALDLAFQQFIAQSGKLIWCCDSPRLCALSPKGISYGFSDKADYPLSHFRQTKEGIRFNLGSYKEIELPLIGRHNALNGAAVFLLALEEKIPEEAIRAAFKIFSGTGRRMEKKGERHKVAVFDDYGHHPNEIRATLRALREQIGERRLVVVFQPHRYTRVRDLFEEFPASFGDADEVIMTDIYSAGEPPIPGFTSASLYTRMREELGPKVHFFPRTHLEAGAAAFLNPLDVVLTIGAGDVTQAGEPILRLYGERAPKLSVGIIFGGRSAEHPVSLMSARNIIGGLDPSVYEVLLFGITKEGEWRSGFDLEGPSENRRISSEILTQLLSCDVCIPVLHGPEGEDGTMAAWFDVLGIPYVGTDHRSGALCMEKGWAKSIALRHNVPVAPFFEIDLHSYRENKTYFLEKIDQLSPYPVWIKPVHLGSSIGVSRALNPQEALSGAELAFRYGDRIIVEKEVEGREIEFSLLGNEMIQIAEPGEIIKRGQFVSYDKKYGPQAMDIQVPASITPIEKEIGFELAETVYRACGCKGLARVDFFLDRNGHYWFNEINPFPGFTDTSGYPKMWKGSGKGIGEVLDEMIGAAFHRTRMRKSS